VVETERGLVRREIDDDKIKLWEDLNILAAEACGVEAMLSSKLFYPPVITVGRGFRMSTIANRIQSCELSPRRPG
jgi:hypothetical protein